MMKKIFATLALVFALCVSVTDPAQAGGFGNRFVCQTAWTPTALATNTQQSKVITCPGVALGDFVEVSFNTDRLLLIATGYVNAANQVTVILNNVSGGTITPTSTLVFASITAKYISP
jgi:hypothetical protein